MIQLWGSQKAKQGCVNTPAPDHHSIGGTGMASDHSTDSLIQPQFEFLTRKLSGCFVSDARV